MKATYTTVNGRITIEATGETPKALFAEIAAIQEVFDSDNVCGVCQSEEIRYIVRRVDDYVFYELRCKEPGCYARLEFGQAKKGGALFPKRKDDDGNWLPNRGWAKYQGTGQRSPAGSTQPSQPARTSGNAPSNAPQPFGHITDEDVPF